MDKGTVPERSSNVKAAGFNLVRVHVHTEQEVFYDLVWRAGNCSFSGFEYNWTHPSTDEWAQRFADVYRENVKSWSIIRLWFCWIIMNEPGCIDPDGNVRRRFMEENPGPALYREVQKMDPADRSSRVLSAKTICLAGTAIIIWVLYAVENMQTFMSRQKSWTQSTDLMHRAAVKNLKNCSGGISSFENRDDIPKIQEYQHKLLKYYTEHYRIQNMNLACIQFISRRSVSSELLRIIWLWIPKKGLQAILKATHQWVLLQSTKINFWTVCIL